MGWVKLYGWKMLNANIMLAIIFHDWGYIGCMTMDGPDGSLHPTRLPKRLVRLLPQESLVQIVYHSRHLSSKYGFEPSLLCWADKIGTAMMPSFLWALMAYLSGEGWEYMSNPNNNDYVEGEDFTLLGLRRFHIKYKEWAWSAIGVSRSDRRTP